MSIYYNVWFVIVYKKYTIKFFLSFIYVIDIFHELDINFEDSGWTVTRSLALWKWTRLIINKSIWVIRGKRYFCYLCFHLNINCFEIFIYYLIYYRKWIYYITLFFDLQRIKMSQRSSTRVLNVIKHLSYYKTFYFILLIVYEMPIYFVWIASSILF